MTVTLVINHWIRISNVNATAAWITCHICSLDSAAPWLPSDLLERPVWGIIGPSRGSSIGAQLSLKHASFAYIIQQKEFCIPKAFRREKTSCVGLKAARTGSNVCPQEQFIADEHMANILSHVTARGKQTPCNVSESARAEPLGQLCKRSWTIWEEEHLLSGYINHIRLISARTPDSHLEIFH